MHMFNVPYTEVVVGAGITSCALSLGNSMGTVPHSSGDSRLGTANVSRNVLSLGHGTTWVLTQLLYLMKLLRMPMIYGCCVNGKFD